MRSPAIACFLPLIRRRPTRASPAVRQSFVFGAVMPTPSTRVLAPERRADATDQAKCWPHIDAPSVREQPESFYCSLSCLSISSRRRACRPARLHDVFSTASRLPRHALCDLGLACDADSQCCLSTESRLSLGALLLQNVCVRASCKCASRSSAIWRGENCRCRVVMWREVGYHRAGIGTRATPSAKKR